MSLEEAVETVDRHLIGWRDSMGGEAGRVIRAAPEALPLLALSPKDIPSEADPGWETVSTLTRGFVGGHKSITLKLTSLQAALIRDMVEQAGLSETLAEALTDRYFVGRRRAIGLPGNGGLYASPQAVALLVAEGLLMRREEYLPRSIAPDSNHIRGKGGPRRTREG